MNPITLLDGIKPARIFTLEEYIKATSNDIDDSITNTSILMDYVNNKHSIQQLDSFRFMKPLTGFEPFIKKIRNDYFNHNLSIEQITESWVKTIPMDSCFTAKDIERICPKDNDPTIKLIILTLEKYVDDGILSKFDSFLGTAYIKVAEVLSTNINKEHYNELQQLFIDFLKKENVYDKFIMELELSTTVKHASKTVISSLDALVKRQLISASNYSWINPVNWIYQSFDFKRCLHGFEFWTNINLKWYKALIIFLEPTIFELLNCFQKYKDLGLIAYDYFNNSIWAISWMKTNNI